MSDEIKKNRHRQSSIDEETKIQLAEAYNSLVRNIKAMEADRISKIDDLIAHINDLLMRPESELEKLLAPDEIADTQKIIQSLRSLVEKATMLRNDNTTR